MKKELMLKMGAFFLIMVIASGGFLYFSKTNIDGGDFIAPQDDLAADVDISSSSTVPTSTDDADFSDTSDAAEPSKPVSNSNTKSSSGNTIKKSVAVSSAANSVGSSIKKASSTSDTAQSIDDSNKNDENVADAASSPQQSSPKICLWNDLDTSSNPSRKVLLNEIAWMGTLQEPGDTSAKASNREWIELKNNSSDTIDLAGWQILDAGGNLKAVLGGDDANTKIVPGGFYLLIRGGGLLPNDIKDDAAYSGGISNAGGQIALVDSNCELSDFVDASSSWPGGNNTTKQTLERDADGVGWHTSAPAGGTPRQENSMPAAPSNYSFTVSINGGGSGIVSSSPVGIFCGPNCQASFASGTKLTFSATPADKSVFAEWSGVCNGSHSPTCSIIVSSSLALSVRFDPVEPPPPTLSPSLENNNNAPQESSSSATNNNSDNSLGHLVISAVQIAGVSSSNDFVKIFNPTGTPIDVSGWKLHKKSSSGSDYSLKSFANGTVIAPNAYFIWANASGGFADSIGANVSSTETLSADNSVALIDGSGAVVDAVAWGTGTNQYVEVAAYPTDPTANQVLGRKTSGGVFMDTNNNADDFSIQ